MPLYEGPREGVHRQVFVPFWGNNGVAFYVRAALGLANRIRRGEERVKRLDPAMPVYEMKTLAAQLDENAL